MTLAERIFTDRPSGKTDYNLIVDSFKRNVAGVHGGKKRWTLAERERAVFDEILILPSTECRVLSSQNSTWSIAGWVAWTPIGQDLVVIHYAFAKWPVRPLGCGEALFQLTGAEGKRLAYTFGGALAEKLCSRLQEAGRIRSYGHIPPKDFLYDMGDDHGRDATG